MVNLTCSIENDVRDFRRFFLNEILQIPKFKFFVSRDKFARIAQIFLKFANVEHNWKIQKLKNYFENIWKIATPFGRRIWKIGTSLTCWQAKLNNWHTFGWLARFLARWHFFWVGEDEWSGWGWMHCLIMPLTNMLRKAGKK